MGRNHRSTLTCARCGGPFPVSSVIDGKARILNRRRFCLRCSPFNSHNTKKLDRVRERRICQSCGADTPNPRFCSNRCQQAFAWQETKTRIEAAGGIPVGGGTRIAKRYLLESRGHECSICGGTEWRGAPMPLVLDHIDGDADNWALGNLRLVCGNCDMQLPTYKAKNRGKGRAWRRARYAEGKSY